MDYLLSNASVTSAEDDVECIDGEREENGDSSETATAISEGEAAEKKDSPTHADRRYSVLSYEQVKRLDSVMDAVVPIHGRGNFPTLEVKLRELVRVVRDKLEKEGVKVRDIRLNGGAASYILTDADSAQSYNDLDLIFGLDLATPRTYDRVKAAVLDAMLDLLPAGVSKTRISSCSLKEAYVHKMVKVTEAADRWSLISLGNSPGRNVELKFVDRMRRQFEFSVDSFQILLDYMLVFYECAEMPMSAAFYPTVVGESVYGDFREALGDLRGKLIATRNPEEIRGGGLLKYCNLLVRGYRAARAEEIKTLERYMCSRFFIDFSDVQQQRAKLEGYIRYHFAGEENLVYAYLLRLHRVVDESTVCLMGHERRQTLCLIEELAVQAYYSQQHHNFLLSGGMDSSNYQVISYCGNGNTYYYAPYNCGPPHHYANCPPMPYSWMSCA